MIVVNKIRQLLAVASLIDYVMCTIFVKLIIFGVCISLFDVSFGYTKVIKS